MSSPDFVVANHGSIFLVLPRNVFARQHLINNTGPEAQWFGRSLVVEPRYVQDLIDRLEDYGYEVSL